MVKKFCRILEEVQAVQAESENVEEIKSFAG